MMRSNLVGLALCGAALACGPQQLSIADRAVAEQAVRARLDGWVLAINNRNLDSLAAYYYHGPELTVAWSDGRRTRGWDAERAVQGDYLAHISQINLTLSDPTIDVLDPRVAIASYGLSIDMLAGKQRSVSAGQGTIVWLKDPADGVWKIRALHTGRKEVAAVDAARRR